MDLKDSWVNGGMLIIHQIHEGKHQYEVENKASGEKAFVRRGEKLMQINGRDLWDLTPEKLAQLLAKDNPMLMVHKAGRVKQYTEQSFPVEDTLHPDPKESTIISFSIETRREEDLEENEVGQEGEGKEDGGVEEDVCQDVNKENGQRGDLLIISMKKTSISVVRGRGCDVGSTCQGCHGTGCTFNNVVVVAESSTVVLVPSGGEEMFRQISKPLNTPIKHVATHHYINGVCPQSTVIVSSNPAKMTIYKYKTNHLSYRGLPVVLNFSNTNCFLRCCKEGERVNLKVKMCEKQKLETIYKSDKSTLSFLFYMKSDRTRQRTFESVLHDGWFIKIDKSLSVKMATLDRGKGDELFLFTIKT